jgi:hypothetical protein
MLGGYGAIKPRIITLPFRSRVSTFPAFCVAFLPLTDGLDHAIYYPNSIGLWIVGVKGRYSCIVIDRCRGPVVVENSIMIRDQ